MAKPWETTERQLARTAVRSLHAAIVLAYQHPEATSLLTTATRRGCDAIQAATRTAPLVLSLHPEGVHVAGELVLAMATNEGPFAALRLAGIGELVLRTGIPGPAIAELIQRLAAMRAGQDTERCVTELIGQKGVPHVMLRATLSSDAEVPRGPDWWRLPAPLLASPALRAFVERDVAANLPALVAHRLLADLDLDPEPAEAVLHSLMARMLERGDFTTAAWLLAHTEHHTLLSIGTSEALHAIARIYADDDWLRQRLETATRDEVMLLAAFVMQLGAEHAARLPRLAKAAGHALAPLLQELLGNS